MNDKNEINIKELEQLKTLYLDPKTGLKSKHLLRKYIIEHDLDISDDTLNYFYKNYEPIQQTKAAFKPSKDQQRQILADYPKHWYQADLMDMSKYEYTNRRYKWILCIIDIFSRYAWAIPLKDKSAVNVAEAFLSVFESPNDNMSPKRITTDNGKEFLNASVEEVMKKYNIRHFTCQPGDHNHMGIVERFNKTLRDKFAKLWVTADSNSFIWIDHLQELVENYNNTEHSTIKNKPIDVFTGDAWNEQEIKDVDEPIFNIGDKVRIKLQVTTFDKKSFMQLLPVENLLDIYYS